MNIDRKRFFLIFETRVKPSIWIIAALGISLLFTPELEAQDGCMDCHGDPDFIIEDEEGREISLFVDVDAMENSIHAGFDCVTCHEDAVGDPHPEQLQKVNCGNCHEDAVEDLAASAHHPNGSQDVPTCSDCHGTHEIYATYDSLSPMFPTNQIRTCGGCHSNPELVEKYHMPIKDPLAAYSLSIHGKLLLAPADYPDLKKKMTEANLDRVATCSSCHSGHKILPANDPASTVAFKNIPQTCGTCHAAIEREFVESVHGVAVTQGVRDAPVCTDCHGEHTIESSRTRESATSPQNVARETCGRCHGSLRIVERYGLQAERVASYETSYHGLASRSGRVTTANCASCHGVHNILPSNNPRSLIHPSNLAETCGKCHGNVQGGFTKGPIHLTESEREGKIVAIVRRIYISLIVLAIAGMLLHNGLDFFRKSKLILRRR